MPAYKPMKERGLRGQPERVFLQSEKGHLTIELFRYIMERFINWWTTTRPGLDCFLVCDNLSVHRDYDIIEMARSNGIHFINIMPGSSHWFQVHDQQPFGILKKTFSEEMQTSSAPVAAESKVKQTVSMAQFYKAEEKAFQPEVVQEAFRVVGLYPWSPEIIKSNCTENSPTLAEQVSSESVKAAVIAIKECEKEKLQQCREMVEDMEPVEVECVQKAKKRVRRESVCVRTTEDGGEGKRQSKSGKKKDMPSAPPQKKARRVSLGRIRCCVEGCGKKVICTKNWTKCSKCQKDFCPSHAKLFRNHVC